jgi:hypothetical protein
VRVALVAIAACVPAIDVAKRADTSVTSAPPFALASHDGQRFVLGEVLAQHDVLLVFYRGHW